MDVPSTIVSVALIVIVALIFYGLIPLAYAYNVKTSIAPKKYRIVCIISFVVMYIFFAMVGYILKGEPFASVIAVTFWTFVFYKIGTRVLCKRGYFDDGKSIMLPNEKAELCPFCETGVSRNMKFCPSCGYDLKTHFENNPPEDEEMHLMKKQQMQNSHQGRKLIMAVVVIVALLIAALFFMTNNTAEEKSISIADVAQSVLYLEVYDENGDFMGTASGFLVNDKRTLVTNYHVVEDAGYLCAYAENGEEVLAEEVLYCDENTDLAVLSLEYDMNVMPLIIADSEQVRQGDEVYAIGYPLGIANTISDGIVSSRYYDYGDVDIIQTTAAISKGNSGGPLVNENGHVIGIICAYLADGQNINIAVASNTLMELITGESIIGESNTWEDRPIIEDTEETYADDIEKEEEPVEELPETKEEPEEITSVITQEQYAVVEEDRKTELALPVEQEEPRAKEEEEELLTVLIVSETEVTVTDYATIYVTCESQGGKDYVMSCDYRGSEINVEWGKKEGNTLPLTIYPWEKGEYQIKIFLKDKPEIYKIIKIHAQ